MSDCLTHFICVLWKEKSKKKRNLCTRDMTKASYPCLAQGHGTIKCVCSCNIYTTGLRVDWRSRLIYIQVKVNDNNSWSLTYASLNRLIAAVLAWYRGPYECCRLLGMMKKSSLEVPERPCCIWYSRAWNTGLSSNASKLACTFSKCLSQDAHKCTFNI